MADDLEKLLGAKKISHKAFVDAVASKIKSMQKEMKLHGIERLYLTDFPISGRELGKGHPCYIRQDEILEDMDGLAERYHPDTEYFIDSYLWTRDYRHDSPNKGAEILLDELKSAEKKLNKLIENKIMPDFSDFFSDK